MLDRAMLVRAMLDRAMLDRVMLDQDVRVCACSFHTAHFHF
jgi:hypothetical protein